MPFWSQDLQGNPTIQDPKRSFRFLVRFGAIAATNGGADLWYAKSATKPSFSVASEPHKYLGHTFNYPGSVTWDDVTITLVDPTTPDMSATLSALMVHSGYEPPSNYDDLITISKAKAVNGLGAVVITQLDSSGAHVEQWTLHNAFITAMKFGDLSYENEGLTELSITLKYDWAKLHVEGEGSATDTEPGQKDFFGV
jgi:hypothetical protein